MDQPTTQSPFPQQPPQAIDEIIKQFVSLRDRIGEAEKAHKAKIAPAKAYLDLLTAALMNQLNSVGGESVKTQFGTAYRTTRRSATIADGKVFRDFVVGTGAFDVVDWRANAGAVEDFIKDNGSPPPGVNFSTAYTVGVRRA